MTMGFTNAERQRRWRDKHRSGCTSAGLTLRNMGSGSMDQAGVGDNMIAHGHGMTQMTATRCADYHGVQYADATNVCSDMPGLPHADNEESQLLRRVHNNNYEDSETSDKMTTRSPEKREKDALRYLALCAGNLTAFRHAIDAVPDSTIRRICDAVLYAMKGDAHCKLTLEQVRLCRKYKRSIEDLTTTKKLLKTKRRLLRSANKQVGGSVFVPFMLQVARDTLGSRLIPTIQ